MQKNSILLKVRVAFKPNIWKIYSKAFGNVVANLMILTYK